MATEIINEQIQDMLNMLDETGEFSQAKLESLSKDPEALFKACLQWEGIIGYEEEIKEWARGLFKAKPILLYEYDEEDPFKLLKKKEDEISYLISLLDERQLDKFNNYLKKNNG